VIRRYVRPKQQRRQPGHHHPLSLLIAEGIYNAHAGILLPVIQIFGINGMAAQRLGGRENEGVPIRNRHEEFLRNLGGSDKIFALDQS
jgi:hypothetical protein